MKKIQTGAILSIKEYNAIKYSEWKDKCNKLSKEGKHNQMPSIQFYLWDKDYGYVYKTDYGSVWRKTKKELLFIKNN
tara:strand:+ start:833 stop:1063 length:231 start_codon:yes stop_codon:yes gene_type:complete